MYSLEERQKAVDLYIKYDLSAADTVRELGYPNRKSLALWYKEYLETGMLHEKHMGGKQHYSAKQKQAAVDHYLQHGKSLSRTARAMGYPSKEALRIWIDELAPSQRKICTSKTKQGKVEYTFEQKKEAVVDLCSRKGAAKEVAEVHGTTRERLYNWKTELLGKDPMPIMPKDEPYTMPDTVDGLLAQIKGLKESVSELESQKGELKGQVYRLQMERDILDATIEIVKKDPGVDPRNLANREKKMAIDALRTR
jgi:transposase-like protein